MTHQPPIIDSCCLPQDHEHKGVDLLLYGCAAIITIAVIIYATGINVLIIGAFPAAIVELLKTMWWGIALGMFFVGLMSKIPREYFQAMIGPGDSASGIVRAVIAGLFVDLCSHGILLIAAKLYERGASLAQVMAFLVASPWNSFSLIVILISLIGAKWTLAFVIASIVVALITGFIYLGLTKIGFIAQNPNKAPMPENFSMIADAKIRLSDFKLTRAFFKDIARSGIHDGLPLVRWLLLGIIIAAAVNAFIPAHHLATWFGPSWSGLVLTLLATAVTVICSEGSAPIAATIFKVAAAPGNAFVFLMAGVSTDYMEIMVLRQITGSWMAALSLPLITVPQILLLGWAMNGFR